jgi:hypothetical protein
MFLLIGLHWSSNELIRSVFLRLADLSQRIRNATAGRTLHVIIGRLVSLFWRFLYLIVVAVGAINQRISAATRSAGV